MAVLQQITCLKCGERKQVCLGPGAMAEQCHDCQAKEDADKRAAYFAELDKLTLEARVRKIEEWIYDYKPYKEPMF